jgi:hypothetical protein
MRGSRLNRLTRQQHRQAESGQAELMHRALSLILAASISDGEAELGVKQQAECYVQANDSPRAGMATSANP